MKRRLFAACLALLMLFGCAFAAAATETENTEETEDVSGEGDGDSCGEEMSWMVEGTTLTISGKGEMYDFEDGAPWAHFKDELTKVILDGDIQTVGAHAFEDFDKLTEIDFGSSLIRIGVRAFAGCDGLASIHLPITFKKFGEECFRSCKNLKEIHCDGGFPRFDTSCLWDTYCTIYYPADAPWSVIYIEQLESAFQGRIEFIDSNGEDHYEPTEPEQTTEATEPAPTETQEVTQPTETVPVETQAETVPATTETVPPETQTEPAPVETQPETTEEAFLLGTLAETTVAETQPPRATSSGMLGMAIVVFTLSITGLGALAFRASNRRDR